MKTLIFSILFLAAIAVTGTNNEPKTLTTADYQSMVNELSVGDPITFFIPPHEKAKLYGICCEPPSSPCQGYCCWRCPDPGKGGLTQ